MRSNTAVGAPLAAAYGCARYEPPVSTAIVRMKFHGRSDIAVRLCDLLPRALGESLAARRPALVPVPAHPLRLIERGYDPPALIARRLSQLGYGSFQGAWLRRVRATAKQSLMPSARARRVNLDGAFEASREARGRSIVLIDDVLTTGATARSCARALWAAGARPIEVVTIAWAARPNGGA